jgi:hypothetical protein
VLRLALFWTLARSGCYRCEQRLLGSFRRQLYDVPIVRDAEPARPGAVPRFFLLLALPIDAGASPWRVVGGDTGAYHRRVVGGDAGACPRRIVGNDAGASLRRVVGLPCSP